VEAVLPQDEVPACVTEAEKLVHPGSFISLALMTNFSSFLVSPNW